MTTAELEKTAREHEDTSEEELADELYAVVKADLDSGADRDQVYSALTEYYEAAKARGDTRLRRAVGDVIRCFDGWCAPSAAL